MASAPHVPAQVTIVTGPIHSGKTTRLSAWIAEQQAAGVRIDGVLAPIVDGRRHLRSIADDSSRCLELAPGAGPPAADEVRIGPHRFSAAVFAWARELLIAAVDPAAERRPQLIVIDEIGPLELRGEGLEPAVSRVLASRESSASVRLILVVREGLVDRVIEHYRLGSVCEVASDMPG